MKDSPTSAPGSSRSNRVRVLRDEPPGPGRFVLYWMIAARRTRFNFALERAVTLARELGRPLLVLEALRADYPFASDRLHRFILDGMRANQRALERTSALYYPYVEETAGAGKGLLKALADHACAVVTDDYPCFFLPAMLERARRDVRMRFEAVDSNGLFPMRSSDRAFARAHDFRRFLHRELPPHLARMPRENPLSRVELPPMSRLPAGIAQRWPRASVKLLSASSATLAALPIDHSVPPVDIEGGSKAGERVLARFVDERLDRYGDGRNDPDSGASSGLSPYLHFGHVSAHQILQRVAAREGWSPPQARGRSDGKREGWWKMSKGAEAFLDQLVTWRELGFNACVHMEDYDRYESLPDWARATLGKHAKDRRPHVYDLAAFEEAQTHDELWNAAQNELRRRGVIHNYMRMLWGKKILHWSPSAREALATMIALNDKYALDGRDPNSYNGIMWVLGRYDRPWGPEREIFGTVRTMTSENTRRKLRVDDYIRRFNASSWLP